MHGWIGSRPDSPDKEGETVAAHDAVNPGPGQAVRMATPERRLLAVMRLHAITAVHGQDGLRTAADRGRSVPQPSRHRTGVDVATARTRPAAARAVTPAIRCGSRSVSSATTGSQADTRQVCRDSARGRIDRFVRRPTRVGCFDGHSHPRTCGSSGAWPRRMAAAERLALLA
jgi:hypothetical protein